jgi:hypothetical protein
MYSRNDAEHEDRPTAQASAAYAPFPKKTAIILGGGADFDQLVVPPQGATSVSGVVGRIHQWDGSFQNRLFEDH